MQKSPFLPTYFMSQNIYFATYAISKKEEDPKYVEISIFIELMHLRVLLLIMIDFGCSVDNFIS